MQVELGPVPAAWQRHPSMDPRPTLRPSLPFTAPLQVEARVTFSFLWPFWILLPSLPLFYHCVFFVPRADLIFLFSIFTRLGGCCFTLPLLMPWQTLCACFRKRTMQLRSDCRRRHQMKLLGTEICDKLGMTLSRLNKVVNVFQFQRSPCKMCFDD